MAFLTQSELKRKIQQAQGTLSPQQVVQSLTRQGHTIEGLNEKKSFLQKTADFVAPLGTSLGKSLAQKSASKMQEGLTEQQTQSDTAIARALKGKTPQEKQRLLDKFKKAGIDVGNLGDRLTVQEQTPGFDISNKQVAGEAIVTAGNILGFGKHGTAGTISSRINAPILRTLTSTGVRQLATTTGLQSAVVSAGHSIADDDSLNTIAQKTAFGFATGFGTSVLFSKLFSGLANRQQKFTNKAENFSKEAFRPTGDVAGRINRDIGKEFIGELEPNQGLLNKIIKRYTGNAEKVRQASTLDIAKYSDEIVDILKQVDADGALKIGKHELFNRAVKNLTVNGVDPTPNQLKALQGILSDLPDNMSVVSANVQKGRWAGQLRGFAPTAKTESFNKEAIRAFWGAAKDTVEDRARLHNIPVDKAMENFSIATDVNEMISRVIDQALKQAGGIGARFRGAGPLNLVGNMILGMRTPRLLRSANIAQQKAGSLATQGITGLGQALQSSRAEAVRKGITTLFGGSR